MNSNVKRGRVNREKRRDAAKARMAGDSPSPERQLQILDERLGVGVGAVKERAVLNGMLTPKKSKQRSKK